MPSVWEPAWSRRTMLRRWAGSTSSWKSSSRAWSGVSGRRAPTKRRGLARSRCGARFTIEKAAEDVVAFDEEPGPPSSRALLVPVVRQGKRLDHRQTPAEVRERCRMQMQELPDRLLALESSAAYAVTPTPALRRSLDTSLQAGRQSRRGQQRSNSSQRFAGLSAVPPRDSM